MSAAAPASRIPGLDAARALAVTAMVIGHTADGLLLDAARAYPWIQTYWKFRGLTAPLFLFVAGWAVMALIGKSEKSGWALVQSRLGRVALLFGIGVLLRFPGWNINGLFAGDRQVWHHLVGFDALHCIAVSLLVGVCVLAFVPSALPRKGVLLALAVGVPLLSGTAAWLGQLDGTPLPVRSALFADYESPFPLFPWMGYFFAGAVTGELLALIPSRWTRVGTLVGGGAALVVFVLVLDMKDLPRWSPVLFAYRLGQVWIIAAAMVALPASLSKPLAPLGRASLVVYVLHLPIVYGWSTIPGLSWRWGRVLSPGEVVLLALCMLAAGVLAAEVIRRAKALRWRAVPVVRSS